MLDERRPPRNLAAGSYPGDRALAIQLTQEENQMNITRLIRTVFAIVALPASCVLAQEKPAAQAPQGASRSRR